MRNASNASALGAGLSVCLSVFQAGCSQPTLLEPTEVDAIDQAIINGHAASPGEWPWQVEINRNGGQWCGGSLLSDRWVLTAAHCVRNQSPAVFTVRAGLVNHASPGPSAQARSVLSYQMHPGYVHATGDNDVALIRLSSPISFGRYAQPIEIAEDDAPAGTLASVTGWGLTVGLGVGSNTLQETTLPVVDSAECNDAGTLTRPVLDSMLCAGHVDGETGGCHGDSGGPLVVPSSSFSNGWKQIGVVSWGVAGTCSSYTVFSRLSVLAPWIHSIVGSVPVYGDVNGDGCVDAADHSAVMHDFGLSVPPGNPAADLDHNGTINIEDRKIVLQNYGEGC